MWKLLLFVACQSGVFAGWTQTVENRNAYLINALSRGDKDGIEGLFDPDGDFTFLQDPSISILLSNQDIADWFMSQREQGVTKLELISDYVTNLGDVANDRGSYKFTSDDGTVVYDGAYVLSWKDTDGQVKITSAMWT